MGDVGDYWNAAREFRRDARSQWAECPSPSCDFGGNPVKVAPGCKCRHCGWLAPGTRGADVRYARTLENNRYRAEEQREQRRREQQRKRTCQHCGKILKSAQGRVAHERDAHSRPSVAG